MCKNVIGCLTRDEGHCMLFLLSRSHQGSCSQCRQGLGDQGAACQVSEGAGAGGAMLAIQEALALQARRDSAIRL